MKLPLIYFLLSTLTVFSQSFEKIRKNENLKKYSSVEIISFYNNKKKTGWSKKISLKDGKINSIRNYNKSTLTYQAEYFYDEKNDLDFEIVKYDINKGKINDTINYSYKYNDKNQLIEQEVLIKEFFSNFNSQNLPQTIESGKSAFDSLCGFRKELIYDIKGNIIQEKEYSKIDNQIKTKTITYKYDEYNNVIELNRVSSPNEKYPIIMIGGPAQFENEKFRYVYNKDNLWVEKYRIVENNEYLILKRKFK
ncbi:hypothetical protein Q361_1552 [Flavobacterium croceum DSM 17960]|uniref:YD repeat-containing protein n=1 Tax=Flavobacterium croceum DSM 17960 TaxID=1121886 RepID=A0A2S4N4C3_9FLAO|nr:hypothetical protein [Flavobacterium croceum]POS00578.1 hypothetical protein Q361_1552 [Flavobacterium croceum DSM 17960]